MAAENKEARFKELAEKYGLTKDDFHVETRGGKKIVTMTRSGIEKIEFQEGIKVEFDLIFFDQKERYVSLWVIAENKHGKKIRTTGESSPYNTQNKYPFAMAEKRGKARAILQMTEFSSLGVYTEEDAEQNDIKANFDNSPL